MSYFEEFVEIAFQRKREVCLEALANLTSQLAADRQLQSGSRWVQTESLLIEQTTEYSEILIQKLMEYETEHSPIELKDFGVAFSSVQAFREFCEEIYKEKRDSGRGAYPVSRQPFDGERMNMAVEEARQNIEGKKLEFKSKRSFWKWAFGDARKRVWAGALTLTGVVLGHALSFFFN